MRRFDRARAAMMVIRLAGAPDRARDELIGTIGPQYGEATVEKVAINAVMAGCKP